MMIDRRESLTAYKPIILILLAAVLGGGVGAFSKISLKEIPPLPFTLLRFILAAATLLPFIVKSRELFSRSTKRVVLVSLLATANVTIFIFGLERTTATISQMLYVAVPLITAILSYFLLKESLAVRKTLGLFIGFAGVIIVILLPVLNGKTVFEGDLLGNLMIFAAVISFSLYLVLSKKLQSEYTPMDMTIFFVLTTTTVQLLLSPFGRGRIWGGWGDLSAEIIFGIVYVGVIGTGIYYLIYQYAVKSATPVVASMILYLQPIFAALWAYWLLGEKITVGLAVGGILSFVGVAMVTYPRKQPMTIEVKSP